MQQKRAKKASERAQAWGFVPTLIYTPVVSDLLPLPPIWRASVGNKSMEIKSISVQINFFFKKSPKTGYLKCQKVHYRCTQRNDLPLEHVWTFIDRLQSTNFIFSRVGFFPHSGLLPQRNLYQSPQKFTKGVPSPPTHQLNKYC